MYEYYAIEKQEIFYMLSVLPLRLEAFVKVCSVPNPYSEIP